MHVKLASVSIAQTHPKDCKEESLEGKLGVMGNKSCILGELSAPCCLSQDQVRNDH